MTPPTSLPSKLCASRGMLRTNLPLRAFAPRSRDSVKVLLTAPRTARGLDAGAPIYASGRQLTVRFESRQSGSFHSFCGAPIPPQPLRQAAQDGGAAWPRPSWPVPVGAAWGGPGAVVTTGGSGGGGRVVSSGVPPPRQPPALACAAPQVRPSSPLRKSGHSELQLCSFHRTSSPATSCWSTSTSAQCTEFVWMCCTTSSPGSSCAPCAGSEPPRSEAGCDGPEAGGGACPGSQDSRGRAVRAPHSAAPAAAADATP